MTALQDLARELRAEGGLVGAIVVDPPQAEEAGSGFPLLLEAIREGERTHYAQPRILGTGDEDLALLAGDRLYALGLERLAAAGDLDAIAALADLISFAAQAHTEGRAAQVDAEFDRVARQITTP